MLPIYSTPVQYKGWNERWKQYMRKPAFLKTIYPQTLSSFISCVVFSDHTVPNDLCTWIILSIYELLCFPITKTDRLFKKRSWSFFVSPGLYYSFCIYSCPCNNFQLFTLFFDIIDPRRNCWFLISKATLSQLYTTRFKNYFCEQNETGKKFAVNYRYERKEIW